MGLLAELRNTFGLTGLERDPTPEGYVADADVPTITIGNTTYNLLDFDLDMTTVGKLPALQRGRQMISDTVARLPARAYRGGELLSADQARRVPMLRRPDPGKSLRQWEIEILLELVDHGNVYVRQTLDPVRNQPVAAEVLNSSKVEVAWRPGGGKRYRYKGAEIPSGQVIHKGLQMGAGDLTGTGPLQSSRLAGLVSMLDYSADYFEKATNPSGVLYDPVDADEDEATDKLTQWEEGHDRGTRYLGGGLKFVPNTMTPGESAWVESHAAGYVDVAVLLGIPVPLLGASLLGGSSSIVYQNLTTVYEQWYRDSLAPTWIPLVEELWSELLPGSMYVELDPDVLTRPDLKQRTELAINTYTAGLVTRDEARATIGYGTGSAELPTAPKQTSEVQ